MNADIRHDRAGEPGLAVLTQLLGIARGADRLPGRPTVRGEAASTRTADVERLCEAFAAFSGASERLERSWAGLQAQVKQLNAELARKNDELARQAAENEALAARQAAILAALPAGVLVLDDAGAVVACNPAGEQLLGAAPGGWTRDAILARLAPAESAGEWSTRTAPPRRVSLTERDLGRGCGTILLLADVTDAHDARERAARGERLAVMGEMAARVAHQLRSPLATAVLYASQLVRTELGAAERARFADKTLARLRHLERMTREVLRYARGDAGESSEIEADTLIDEAAQLMAPLMAGRGIAFSAAGLTGGAVVRGDRSSLVGALTSLLENALQATPQGGKVRVTAIANRNKVRLCVTDSGCGIPPGTLERVFEPFYTTRPDGTGLGLAIVRSTVEACGGTIEVDSRPGEGTSFVLDLPRARGMQGAVPAAGAEVRMPPRLVAAAGPADEQEAA